MKKTLALLVLGLPLLALPACDHHYLLSPMPVTPTPTITVTFTPTVTSTPTQTLVPGCGFTPVIISTPGIPAPVPTYSATVVPTFFPLNTVPGTTLIIKSQADWEAYYGITPAPPAPVDFNAQMLIVNLQTYPENFQPAYFTITGVCWDDTQITITGTRNIPCSPFPIFPIQLPTPLPTPTPVPPAWYYWITAVVVPRSDLPVVWNPLQLIFNPCPL